jgi:hypothetical protein
MGEINHIEKPLTRRRDVAKDKEGIPKPVI